MNLTVLGMLVIGLGVWLAAAALLALGLSRWYRYLRSLR